MCVTKGSGVAEKVRKVLWPVYWYAPDDSFCGIFAPCLCALTHFKDGAPVLSYPFVQSKRRGKTVKQGILLWFGVDFTEPKHRWKAVAPLVNARYVRQFDLRAARPESGTR